MTTHWTVSARSGDWHVCLGTAKGIWSCAKTIDGALRSMYFACISHDIDVSHIVATLQGDRWTRRVLHKPALISNYSATWEVVGADAQYYAILRDEYRNGEMWGLAEFAAGFYPCYPDTVVCNAELIDEAQYRHLESFDYPKGFTLPHEWNGMRPTLIPEHWLRCQH